jgi:murein L,D-transpeptidase YcbB/YkuD
MRRHRTPSIAVVIAALVAGACARGSTAQAADTVSEHITALVASTSTATKPSDHGAAQAVRAAYARTSDAPLWIHDGQPSTQAQAVLHELADAEAYGLQSRDYGASALMELSRSPETSAAQWAQFDVTTSVAAVHFMRDLHYGRVDPKAAGFNLEVSHEELDLGHALEGLAGAADVHGYLSTVEPQFHHYQLLKAHLAEYRRLAQQPQLTHLPALVSTVKPGQTYAGASELRRLLIALGDLPPEYGAATEPTFDEHLSEGVRAFQQRHGLAADGALGKGTFAALTTPLARRLRQIDLTLERWRWLPPFQTPPIIVNIPQFRLFAFRTTEDRVADILQMDVIVGRVYPKMQTPVFESNMRYVVMRPYWDVPRSITRNEMLPKIRANPRYLAAQRLEMVRGQSDSSPVVPPSPEAIEALAAGELRLRQLPGEDNALGLIKFMFPNDYSVYLHSTPAHRLFGESVRAFSHGCIRVSDPLSLAVEVLKNAPGEWSREKIDATMNGASTSVRVNLTQPINVLILYGTALATEAGQMMFFDDLYGYDKKLERQLALPPP